MLPPVLNTLHAFVKTFRRHFRQLVCNRWCIIEQTSDIQHNKDRYCCSVCVFCRKHASLPTGIALNMCVVLKMLQDLHGGNNVGPLLVVVELGFCQSFWNRIIWVLHILGIIFFLFFNLVGLFIIRQTLNSNRMEITSFSFVFTSQELDYCLTIKPVYVYVCPLNNSRQHL